MVDTAKVELAVGAGEGGGRMTVDCCCGGSSRWLRFPLQWMAGMFEDDARCGVDGRWFAMVVSGFLGCVKVMTEAVGEDGCRWFALAHGCDRCVNEWQW